MKIGLNFLIGCCGLLLCAKALGAELPSTPPRVVMVENPQATVAFEARLNEVIPMVNSGVERITLKTNLSEAWLSLVSTQDVVGIKVFSSPGARSGTRPFVVEAVVKGLLAAGISPQHIIIWDKELADLRRAGYVTLAGRYGVRAMGSLDEGYDDKVFYESSVIGKLVWGDFEFGSKDEKAGRKSFVSKLLTHEITKIINIAPLLNHNGAGVNGCLFSLSLGSVDNSMRFESQPNRMAIAVPEIYALPILCDRVVLNITDALIAQYEGEQLSLLHYSSILNQIWFSKDPVALDVLAVDELDRDRQAKNMPPGFKNAELYQNAALMELGIGDVKRIKTELVR